MIGHLHLTAALALTVAAVPAFGQPSLPNPDLTPGAINPAVSQEDIDHTICVRGWTEFIRPPKEYTEELKRQQIYQYGYRNHRLGAYEEDHLIPLDLGGAPRDPRNLWPEPWRPRDGWGAAKKDELEAELARLVCAGDVPLATAQQDIARDWEAAYRKYLGGERYRKHVYRSRSGYPHGELE